MPSPSPAREKKLPPDRCGISQSGPEVMTAGFRNPIRLLEAGTSHPAPAGVSAVVKYEGEACSTVRLNSADAAPERHVVRQEPGRKFTWSVVVVCDGTLVAAR